MYIQYILNHILSGYTIIIILIYMNGCMISAVINCASALSNNDT